MKIRLFLILSLFSLIFLAGKNFSFAAVSPTPKTTTTPSPSSSITSTDLNQQINDLKERIASRVAQLNLVEKRGTVGQVTDVSQTQLSLSDRDGNAAFVDVDELTQFSSPSAKASFGISDILKGTTVSVLGLYNKESKRILARFVDVVTPFQSLSGAVSAIDGDNYTISMTTPDQTDYMVDIESVTKTLVYTKADGLIRSGFSKISQGERIVVVGFWDKNRKNRIVATRIIRFPELKINPKITLFKPGELNTVNTVPSTGSGIKLIPNVKKTK